MSGTRFTDIRRFDSIDSTNRYMLGEARLGAPEGVGLVGQSDMERFPVELGVDGHRGHTQLAAGSDDPDGYLPPVGDENLLQHAAPFESDGGGRWLHRPEAF